MHDVMQSLSRHIEELGPLWSTSSSSPSHRISVIRLQLVLRSSHASVTLTIKWTLCTRSFLFVSHAIERKEKER